MRISTLFSTLVFLIITSCVRTFGIGVDHNFKTQITNADGTYINAIAVQPDGKFLVGGKFGYINGELRPGIARLNADGTLDASFNSQINASTVNCFLIQPDGKILVGGFVSATYNSTTRGGTLRLNPDGSLDTTFFNGTGSWEVKAIAVQPDGKVIVGGTFSSANDVTRRRIARYNADGSLDMSFDPNPLGDGINSVQALPDGKILVGGDFDSIAGQQRRGFVRLNSDGSLDQSFLAFGIDQVNVIKLQPDNKILIGGRITAVNNILRRTVARLNPDGSLDESFTFGGNAVFGNPYAFELLPGGGILVGGSFSEFAGETPPNLFRLNPNGSVDQSFPSILVFSPVLAVAQQADGRLLVGGSRPGDQRNRSLLRRLNTDGTTETSFPAWVSDPFDSLGPPVVQPDGKILIYGDFTEVNGVDRKRIARLNPDGSVDLTFNPGSGVNGAIAELALQPDGKMVIGGDFGLVNGSSQARVARLNADGSRDTTFNTGVGADRIVTSVAIAPDGKIMLGGLFTTINWVSRPKIARLNPDGSLDMSFNVGTPGPNNAIHDMAFLPGGKMLISGPFGNISGVPARNIARLNNDGSIDPTFSVGTGPGGLQLTTIGSMAVQPDGKIVVGGTFLNYNGVPRSCLARINSDGSLDTEFAPMTQNVYDVRLMPDGKIIVSGNVQIIDNVPQRYVSRLNPDGTVDLSFNIGTGPSNVVAGVARQNNGDLIVTGEFWRFDGRDHLGIAKLRAGAVAPYDFDGDGKSDLSVFRPSDGVWYLSRSTAGFGALRFGIQSDRLAPADYDGDGKTDIAVFRDGNWYLQRSQTGFAAVQFGASGDVPQPADFDGDGRAELAVFRPSAGSWYVLNLVNNQFTGVQFGTNLDKPVAADYDGDGKADYAVFRPSDGTWYMLRSQQGFTGVQFGISTDKPVVGDYDGDGKADPAVYRDGVWYQLRSGQGFAAAQFGIQVDLPAPADYDGDGKTDLAVYRDNTWYLLRSTGGFTGAQFGAAGDKPVPGAFVH
jgi:uncharacterized delta-60 repeat protein